MNQKRRKVLHLVLDELARLKDPLEKSEAQAIIKKACEDTESCLDDEECALDMLPESLKWSTMADTLTENISDLSDAVADLEGLLESCSELECYDYEKLRSDAVKIVNTIKNAIER